MQVLSRRISPLFAISDLKTYFDGRNTGNSSMSFVATAGGGGFINTAGGNPCIQP